MKSILTGPFLGTLLGVLVAAPTLAQQAGDIAAGEAEFRKCRSCHMVRDDQGNDLIKGGIIGPNLWGVVGQKIASVEGYAYGDGLRAVAEADPDMVWTQEELIAYITDPRAWLQEKTGDAGARTKMTFKLTRNQADIAAYLASVSPTGQ